MEPAHRKSSDNTDNSVFLPNDLASLLLAWNEESGTSPASSTSLLSAEQVGSILRSSSFLREDVPLYIFEALLHSDARESLVYAREDETGRTILHHVVANLDRPDLVRLLLESSADNSSTQRHGRMTALLNMRDAEGFLPIDIISRRIVMKEERFKYKRGNDAKSSQEAMALTAQWRCVYLWTSALAGNLVNSSDEESLSFLVHSCLRVSHEIPLALVMQALRRFPEQACIADCQGNLPLHVFLMSAQSLQQEHTTTSTSTTTTTTTTTTFMNDEEDPILPKLLQFTPSASLLHKNQAGSIPVELAIKASQLHYHQQQQRCITSRHVNDCAFSDRIMQLIQACPESVSMIVPLRLLPFVLQRLSCSSSSLPTIFRVLRSIPEEIPRNVS